MTNQVNTTLVVNAANGGVDEYLKKIEAQVDRISKKISNMGGQYSQALANVLDPSRSPAATKAAGTVFTQATEGMTRLMEAQTTQMKVKGAEAKAAVQNTADRNRLTSARNLSMYGTENVEAITKIQQAKAAAALDTYTKRTTAIGDRANASTAQTLAGYDARELRKVKVQDILDEWNAPNMEVVGKKKKKIAQGFVDIANQRLGIRQAGAAVNIQNEQTAQMGADRRYAERGGTIRDVIADRSGYLAAQRADRGATKAEYSKQQADERREKHEQMREARKWRQEDRAQQRQDRAERRQQYNQDAAASQLLGAMPGGGMLSRMGQMATMLSPTFAGAIGNVSSSLVNRLSLPLTMSRMQGPANPGAAAGTHGAAAPGGGYLNALGPMGIAANIGMVGLGGAALGAAAVTQLDKWAIGSAKGTFGPAMSSIMSMEKSLQTVGNAGGPGSVSEFLAQPYVGTLGRMGMSRPETAAAAASFLSARGRSTPQGDMGTFLRSSRRFGTDFGMGGTFNALGYSGREFDQMQRGLFGAGIGMGPMMQQQMMMLGAADQRAAGLGLGRTGIAGANVAYTQQLAGQGYGGGQYGAVNMVNKLQGIGNNPADAIRASMGQMADTLVFAESVKRSGNLFGGIEGVSKMTAQQKHDILRGSSAGQIGMFGKDISYDAARGIVRGTPVVSPEVKDFDMEYTKRQIGTENQVMDTGIANGLIEGMQRLDNSMKLLDASMARALNFAAEQNRISYAAEVAERRAPGLGWLLPNF
jgi:hypothetical protein